MADSIDMSFGQLGEKVADILTPYKPAYSVFGLELLKSDPIIDFAKRWGFKVVTYDLDPYPLHMAAIIAVRMLIFIIVTTTITYFMYHVNQHNSPLIKYGTVGGLITTFMAWPLVTGMSGVMLLDFWRPALGFRTSLLTWDIFIIRTREEVESWSFPRFLAHLWAFPKEEEVIAERERIEGRKRNPRLENLKGMPTVIVMFFLLYFIPPYEYTIGMSRLKYHIYCDILGLDILMALALFGDGLLKGLGIILGVEMANMFENPLGTTNIRLWWSHWNRAIATVLHRVVFKGGQNKRWKGSALTQDGARLIALKTRDHLDHLSETDGEGKTDDENEKRGSRSRSGLKPMTPANGNGDGDGDTAQGKLQASSKSRSPFMPKAMAAIATFAMSGIFHEHITYFTLGFANGENFFFFLANGFATVLSTWFKRTYPETNTKIPTWLAVIMLHAFLLSVSPLFCSPFIRSGFFTQMDALKYEILPIATRQRGSFIFLVGE
ncbi:hypothetical protein K437DRAFT_256370 [Tilletiaria anomala UBC 951]|uniref:Wax synthase domain-containing protein n=1 Tax=Tilletiaria anomala (strain ATCC 24038 / CBS 436.72 / UBC 951) TaxID=1037660 RepID=A0A066W5B0_TILAU|nr:uncharacterized protein K437DRAFT_256370 [Tilletiaria anomala UBC 951]KDN45955.1 hypothetical protein K437DRAFT_256370 [Tilletiaria anomala UBC 951]